LDHCIYWLSVHTTKKCDFGSKSLGKWAGKFVIGLTGNIGTGKSVVRKMLEHLGAYGIDADALAHRAIAKGAPGYEPVLQQFGRWVLDSDLEVDRSKLGKLVFIDPEAMGSLEKIIHPFVGQAIDLLVKRAPQPVVVIEAIKLLEAGIGRSCDSIWVTYASPEMQLQRLVNKRGMSEADARQRIAAQPSQQEKVAAAKVVIKNVKDFGDTWRQVSDAWQKNVPFKEVESTLPVAGPTRPLVFIPQPLKGEITVVRGKPRHSVQIAELLNRMKKPAEHPLGQEDIMAAFGEKAFLLLQVGTEIVGVVGWQVENLVARTLDLVIDPRLSMEKALPPLINEMERASKELQCEVSLVFISNELSKFHNEWQKLGYVQRIPVSLGIQAWQEAARESLKPGMTMYFKQLRTDRVLRPI
jgi:dephospho-CoA kinase